MTRVIAKERCPVCAKRGKDTRGDNLAVYDDGHKFCFSCLYFVPGNKIFNVKEHFFGLQKEKETNVTLPEDVTTIPNESSLAWFYSFGFNYSDVIANRILWSDSFQRLIFPIFDNENNLIAWQGRYFGNEKRPKWLSYGKIHDIVYTLGQKQNKLVLVEDIVSCMKLAKANVYSGCLFGSNPSKSMLNRYKLLGDKLVFWLDNDKQRESIQFKRFCDGIGIPSSCIFTTLDPKEYSERQVREYVSKIY